MQTGITISAHLRIPESELSESFVRSSGPGGQNVNKVSSAVELRFDVKGSASLPEPLRERLLTRADRRLTGAGVMVIQANRFRDQGRNREDARLRLAAWIHSATLIPKKRIATKPTRASRERRLGNKRVAGERKRARHRANLGSE